VSRINPDPHQSDEDPQHVNTGMTEKQSGFSYFQPNKALAWLFPRLLKYLLSASLNKP
jgi:hypothetical protein